MRRPPPTPFDQPIRTLHVLTSLNRRGAETFAIQLVERLSRDLFLPSIWTITPTVSGGSYLMPERTIVLSQDGPEAASLHHTVRQLLGVIKVWRPDIIQCHGGRALKYTMLAKPFHGRCAYVYTKIGSIHPWLDPLHKRLFYGYLFEQVDAIVAVGDQVRREVETVFHPRRPRLLTIHTGRDVAPFAGVTPEITAEKRRDLDLEETDLCLMSVGSLSWEKDPQFLLSVLAAVLPAYPTAKLVYVGDGPLAGDLRAQAARDGLTDFVRFAGLRSDVPHLLSVADVFLLPSITEGLPGVLIESGMAGVPSVSFRIGSVDDVLKDGGTGFVVPAGDREAFIARTRDLLQDAEMRARMGAAARAFCRSEFDINRSVRRHEALFLELARASGRHPALDETIPDGRGLPNA